MPIPKGKASDWLAENKAKAVKIIYAHLYQLPSRHHYKLIFMRRNLREVLASQAQMLERSDKAGSRLDEVELARVFGKALAKVQDWLFAQENIEVLYVDYGETLERPQLTAERVRDFLGCELNTTAMARAVDPSLRRQGAS